MLTLSRQKDDSVIIGDDLLVTVTDIQPDRAAILLSHRVGGRISSWTQAGRRWMYNGEEIALTRQAPIKCLLLKIETNTVRLGFILPKGVQLHRKEIYDLIHPEWN